MVYIKIWYVTQKEKEGKDMKGMYEKYRNI